MILVRQTNIFVIGALSVAFCAAPSDRAAVIEHSAQSVAKPTPESGSVPALPPPGTYKVDPDHSFVYFGAWHHVVGLVRGRFDKVTGAITASKDPAACTVDIMIDPSSISTQNTERDEDLRGPAYFDVKKFQTMTYQGRGIRVASGGFWTMDGSLTIHGVANPVPLTFIFKGSIPDVPPGKAARMSFHGTAATKRADFGIGARDNLSELGISPAGPDIEIQIDVEAEETSPKQ
jgi:polyisoprenoid-binding protein YceI